MFPLLQKYLNPQIRTNKLVNYFCLPPLSFKISLRDRSFHIYLNSLSLSRMLVEFSDLYIPPCVRKIYGVRIPRKYIESMHFYSCPSPPLKTSGRISWKSVSPRRKGWRKLWVGLSKFNQKIWRWYRTLAYLYFAWFVIFENVIP